MNNTNKTLAGILTAEDVAAIMAAAPFDEIELDGLGYETYEDKEHHLSLALKYESGLDEMEEAGYFVNLFYHTDEYINIPGYFSLDQLLHNSVLHETVAREWNRLVMYETKLALSAPVPSTRNRFWFKVQSMESLVGLFFTEPWRNLKDYGNREGDTTWDGLFRNWFTAKHNASIDDAEAIEKHNKAEHCVIKNGGTFEPLTFAETADRVKAAEQVLRNAGIAVEDVPAVLQTLGKVLLDENIYEEEK